MRSHRKRVEGPQRGQPPAGTDRDGDISRQGRRIARHVADRTRLEREYGIHRGGARARTRRVEDDQVGLNIEGEDEVTVYFPFAWIIDAKLVMTDTLMKRGAEQRAARIKSDNEDLSESEED